MATVIVGLVSDPHQARGLIRALDDAGFSGEDIDMSGGLLSELVARGVPDEEASLFAEGVHRGGAIVCVRTDEDEEAVEAAELMGEHGAPGRIYHDPRVERYSGRERRVRQEPYDGVNRRAI
ncbi:MAG TPA: hypothetical protein VGJ74_05540 [Burkholderiales bacterium]|jgi:hypothetical protein